MTHRQMFWLMVRRSLTRRRSRVLIAILAVAIGATTLFALATLATDIPRQMAREMRSYGANLLVLPTEGEAALDMTVAGEIAALLPAGDVLGYAPYRYETATINSQPFLAAGTDVGRARAVSPFWYVEGEWPGGPGDVLLGRDVAAAVGLGPGDTVTVALTPEVGEVPTGSGPGDGSGTGNEPGPEDGSGTGSDAGDGVSDDDAGDDASESPDSGGAPGPGEVKARFTVTGILETGASEDALIVMDLGDLEALAGQPGMVDVIEFSVAADAAQLTTWANHITAEVPTVTAAAVRRLAQSDTHVLEMLRSLLGLVSGIVLALTMIGVSTTMMAVVAERREEIGLRKALGADDRAIGREFLTEAVTLGAVGGFGGLGLGYALAQVISRSVFHRSVGVEWTLAAFTVIASVAVTWLACHLPVRRAARIDPATTLRGE